MAKRSPQATAADPGLDKLARLAEMRRELDAAIGAQTDELLKAGYSYGEIGAALGVTRQAARQARLRQGIARDDGQPQPQPPVIL